MKKLFLIFTLLFLTFFVKAQFPITQNLGGPTTLVRVPANGGLQGSLINRNFTDTTAANLTAIDYYAGSQIFTTTDGKFWVRNAAATEWIDISAGGNAGDLVPFYGCVSGCTVTWLQDYDYEVVASVYYINGVRYESGTDTVTLDPSDPTNDRIDVFVLDTSGAADKVTGTAAATPIEPDVDALTQLRISFALVENNTTEPTIGNVWIYRENDGPPTEWTTATVSGTINLASTNFPYAGTKDIEATNMPALASFTATSSTSVSWGSYDALVFKIRSKGNWTTNRPLQIYLYNSTLGLKTPPVILNTGQYGFNSSTTGVYQNVTIPLADFGNIVNMNAIQFARTSGSGTIGWYIDDIQLTTINFNPPASSGTVTSFAAGNLSPLFTTTVTNPTSTPTLSFTLSNAGAYTYFGNNTGTSAAPTYTSIRSLSASSALTDSLLVSSGGQLKLLAQSAVVPITNNVSVLNDSTILVCNYLNVCDTFEISTVTAQYVYIVNDSTLLVCASDNSTCDTLNIPQTFFDRGFFSPNQASFGTTFHNAYNNDFIVVAMDTFSTDADHYLMALDGLPFSTATSLRYLAIDTLTSKLYRTSGGGLVTADNGLTANTATNVRWGGTLVANTTITGGNFNINYTSIGKVTTTNTQTAQSATARVFEVNNSGATFDATGSNLTSFLGYFSNTASRSAGANNLTNIGIYSTATGGQINYAGYFDGDVNIVGTNATVPALRITNNSIGASSIVSIESSSTAAVSNTQKGINVSLSGANATSGQSTHGVYSANTHTGSTSTNYAGYFTSSGATTNYGIYSSGSTYGVFGTGTTYGVYGSGSGGYGVFGTGSIGVYGYSTANEGGIFSSQPSSTSTVIPVLRIERASSSAGANEIGGSIDFRVYTDLPTLRLSNQLISKWTTAADATRTSQFIITGVTSATTQDIIYFEGNGRTRFNGRAQFTQGADVASVAGAIAVGLDGNVFELTGTNAVTLISNLNWQNGSEITFVFTSTATLTDGTANSGTDIGMELAGNANFVGTAGDVVTLILVDLAGTQRWYEKSRSVN